MRREFSKISQETARAIHNQLRQKNDGKSIVADYLRENPEILYEQFAKIGLPVEHWEIAKSYVDANLESYFHKHSKEYNSILDSSFERIIKKIPETVVRAQNKALESPVAINARTEMHKKLSYTAIEADDSIVLPDTAISVISGKRIRPTSEKTHIPTEVIIPVSDRKYIYGFRGDPIRRTPSTVNNILTSCAYESFISKKKRADFERLRARIGRNAVMVKDVEIKRISSLRRN